VKLGPAADAVRFARERFAVGGVAYDAISGRFVVADQGERKLIVVDERSSQAMDLVRAESAGFGDISAIEIDPKRGDLWVTSAASGAGGGTLHRVQLISGRPLQSYRVGDADAVKLADVAVDQNGVVLVLDSMAPRLLVLRPRAATLEGGIRLDTPQPLSVTTGADDGIAFVAHRDGVSRIDLRSGSASPVAAPKGVSLERLERIRRRGNALIALQGTGDGQRRILRLEMNAKGTAIARATQLEVAAPMTGLAFLTVAGDELVYVAASPDASGSSAGGSSGQGAFTAYRVPLP
jgi:hypothetical protein